jgi:hypothetical protein
MQVTRAKLPYGGPQQHEPRAAADKSAVLVKSIRAALVGYLTGRKLLRVQIRRVEGGRIEGFLKIESGAGESFLVDFRATSSPKGLLTSLEVGGRKVLSGVDAPATKRAG